MPPSHRLLGAQYLLRRAHPLTPVASRMLRRTESATSEQLADFQERRLRSLVRLAAARSPFYRRWFAEAGVDPRSIRGLEDLGSLPVLDRSHLAARAELFRTRPAATMWSAHSSGTSGRVVTVHRTQWSALVEHALLERQRRWFDVPYRARSVVLRGRGFGADADGSVTREIPAADRLVVSSFHLDERNAGRIFDTVERFGPDIVEGWPSSICLLAQLMLDHRRHLPVRAVFTSSEVMTTAQRTLIEEAFEAPIVDQYGQTERVAMAGVCEAGGYHVFPDYAIVELFEVPGRPDRFEIVGTPLHNRGFPIFRYRTGDEVGPAPAAGCPCGRAFPLIGMIDGRREDAFTASDGRPLPIPSIVLDDLPGLGEAQIIQHAPGDFEIRVTPGPGFDLEKARSRATANVEQFYGSGQRVTFHVVDRIPRTASGKFRLAYRTDVPGNAGGAAPAATPPATTADGVR